MKIKKIMVCMIVVISMLLIAGCGKILSETDSGDTGAVSSSNMSAVIDNEVDKKTKDKTEISKEKTIEVKSDKSNNKSVAKTTGKNNSNKDISVVSASTKDENRYVKANNNEKKSVAEPTTESTSESASTPSTEDVSNDPPDDTVCSDDADSSEPEEEGPTEQSTQTDESTTESPPQTIASYSPYNVVSLATNKCISGGMIRITDYLDQRLAEGGITEEEYNEYYPYDGLGYYSVFVETDLNAASTTSGRKLGSEQGIADYIADMLLLETEPYFLIEYAGENNGFYEFRCYR